MAEVRSVGSDVIFIGFEVLTAVVMKMLHCSILLHYIDMTSVLLLCRLCTTSVTFHPSFSVLTLHVSANKAKKPQVTSYIETSKQSPSITQARQTPAAQGHRN
jgi:hypothetical protein